MGLLERTGAVSITVNIPNFRINCVVTQRGRYRGRGVYVRERG